jgi:Transposase DDE domain group 1
MIRRSVTQERLDFQLESTPDTITSRAGLALFQETALVLGVKKCIRENLPGPGSNRGIKPHEYVLPLVMMLCGGGRALEDIREIQTDDGLRRLCRYDRLPGADAIGEWLRRPGNLKGLKQVNRHLARGVIARSTQTDFTLDVDATFIETEKQCAKMTYKGFRGFAALLSFIAELDLCVACDYRQGSVPAGVGVKEQLVATHRLLKTCGKRLKYFRSDSAGYMAGVINACQELGVTFTITADQDAAVKTILKQLSRQGGWTRFFNPDGERTDREYKTAIHCMEKTKAFTLIIQRWPNPKPDMFNPESYCYYVIATNDGERSPKEIIWFHNGRGKAENYNKEIKSGFGMDYAPCGQLNADATYFELGVLSHNLTTAVKRLVLGGNWATRTIASLRWQLIQIAGKVVRHGRRLILRVQERHYDLLRSIRQKLNALAAVATPT